jgi:hypothetical protein
VEERKIMFEPIVRAGVPRAIGIDPISLAKEKS